MANLLQKLVKTQSHRRIITSFQHGQNLLAPPLIQSPHINQSKIEDEFNNIPNSQLGFHQSKDMNCNGLQIYPSFPFGFVLNPISAPPECDLSELNKEDGVERDESNTVWADSVKKKRKKKMNKHKYRKLKKRLRRKT